MSDDLLERAAKNRVTPLEQIKNELEDAYMTRLQHEILYGKETEVTNKENISTSSNQNT